MKRFSNFSRYDAFAKPLQDFRIQTCSGAILTIVSYFLISCLVFHELMLYLTPINRQEIFIDNIRNDRMKINIDIKFPSVGCALLSFDARDVNGEFTSDTDHIIHKTALDNTGNEISEPKRHVVNAASMTSNTTCGSCYGAESKEIKCCNKCQDILDAYRIKGWATVDLSNFEQCKKEGYGAHTNHGGCRLHGELAVNKVAGTFHISPGVSYAKNGIHVHDLGGMTSKEMNFSHEIKSLRFGRAYPGQINPLEATKANLEILAPVHTYYLKLVPTLYNCENEKDVKTYQYSVNSLTRLSYLSKASDSSENAVVSSSIPGLFIQYEISPILVRITPGKQSFLHFLVNLCTIVGGVFTVASLIDTFLYRSSMYLTKNK